MTGGVNDFKMTGGKEISNQEASCTGLSFSPQIPFGSPPLISTSYLKFQHPESLHFKNLDLPSRAQRFFSTRCSNYLEGTKERQSLGFSLS